ncbi:hypothetical protein MTZ49_02620 [Entomomonas sp. E2T0]|uniref:hypothetical protein n=1 Tax=Entomomonas sp. E2T0 TaxID=2930213 RepID=UPI0022284AA2|nr:hypothetical protein [Entomomonas sp. E2T0]UYZ84483.1 hypothetical protein MTZ49_02620 [Entomomonas sp. E2T0]
MGHHIQGIISKSDNINAFARYYSLKKRISLSQGFSLLMLSEDDLDSFIFSANYDLYDINGLSDKLVEILSHYSLQAPIAYIATDYFGGTGSQAAIAFANGNIILPPQCAEIGVINQALKLIGVISNNIIDEFDTLNLGQYRHMDED